jgi:hypothetical protein
VAAVLDPLLLSFGEAMLPYFSAARPRFMEDLLMGGRRMLAGRCLCLPRELPLPLFTQLPVRGVLGNSKDLGA